MDYGNILRRSWDVIWNHKFMLVLGFLAALGSGVGSGGGGNNANYSLDGSEFESMPFETIPEITQNMEAVMAAVAAAGLSTHTAHGAVPADKTISGWVKDISITATKTFDHFSIDVVR